MRAPASEPAIGSIELVDQYSASDCTCFRSVLVFDECFQDHDSKPVVVSMGGWSPGRIIVIRKDGRRVIHHWYSRKRNDPGKQHPRETETLIRLTRSLCGASCEIESCHWSTVIDFCTSCRLWSRSLYALNLAIRRKSRHMIDGTCAP